MHSTDIQWSAILSWGYADNILRLKSKQSEPPVNFIQSSQFHQVKISLSSPVDFQLIIQWLDVAVFTLAFIFCHAYSKQEFLLCGDEHPSTTLCSCPMFSFQSVRFSFIGMCPLLLQWHSSWMCSCIRQRSVLNAFDFCSFSLLWIIGVNLLKLNFGPRKKLKTRKNNRCLSLEGEFHYSLIPLGKKKKKRIA